MLNNEIKKINFKKNTSKKKPRQPELTWLTHYIRNEIGIKKLLLF